jgi:hypothetical protein
MLAEVGKGNVTVGLEKRNLSPGIVFCGSSIILPVKSYGALSGGTESRSTFVLFEGITSSFRS